jgi:hypothetical protein
MDFLQILLKTGLIVSTIGVSIFTARIAYAIGRCEDSMIDPMIKENLIITIKNNLLISLFILILQLVCLTNIIQV